MGVVVLFAKALAVALGASLGVWAVTVFDELVFEPWIKRRKRGS